VRQDTIINKNANAKVSKACGRNIVVEARGGDAYTWDVMYLHSDGWFPKLLPELHAKLMQTMQTVDKENWHMTVDTDTVNVRCAEYHRMSKGGALRETGHYDMGSLVTLDLMLTKAGADFEGGTFTTKEPDGMRTHARTHTHTHRLQMRISTICACSRTHTYT
jgi:hypothetical protein